MVKKFGPRGFIAEDPTDVRAQHKRLRAFDGRGGVGGVRPAGGKRGEEQSRHPAEILACFHGKMNLPACAQSFRSISTTDEKSCLAVILGVGFFHLLQRARHRGQFDPVLLRRRDGIAQVLRH